MAGLGSLLLFSGIRKIFLPCYQYCCFLNLVLPRQILCQLHQKCLFESFFSSHLMSLLALMSILSATLTIASIVLSIQWRTQIPWESLSWFKGMKSPFWSLKSFVVFQQIIHLHVFLLSYILLRHLVSNAESCPLNFMLSPLIHKVFASRAIFSSSYLFCSFLINPCEIVKVWYGKNE